MPVPVALIAEATIAIVPVVRDMLNASKDGVELTNEQIEQAIARAMTSGEDIHSMAAKARSEREEQGRDSG